MKKILFIIALAFVVCLINSTYTYAATNNSEAKLERQIKREKKKIERLRKQSSKEFQKMYKKNEKLRLRLSAYMGDVYM